MYKDKDKQKEANRLASQRRRQGMTQGMTESGYDEPKDLGMTPEDLPKCVPSITLPSTTEELVAMPHEDCKEILHSWLRGEGTEYQQTLARLSSVNIPFSQTNAVCNKNIPQSEIHRRNEETMAKLRNTPIAELEKNKTWIPNWRREQGRLVNV